MMHGLFVFINISDIHNKTLCTVRVNNDSLGHILFCSRTFPSYIYTKSLVFECSVQFVTVSHRTIPP